MIFLNLSTIPLYRVKELRKFFKSTNRRGDRKIVMIIIIKKELQVSRRSFLLAVIFLRKFWLNINIIIK